MDKETKELIHIIKNLLHKLPDKSTGTTLEYSQLFLIAKRNSVANTVADVIAG